MPSSAAASVGRRRSGSAVDWLGGIGFVSFLIRNALHQFVGKYAVQRFPRDDEAFTETDDRDGKPVGSREPIGRSAVDAEPNGDLLNRVGAALRRMEGRHEHAPITAHRTR